LGRTDDVPSIPQVVLIDLPDLGPASRDLVRHASRTVTAADGLPLVLALRGVDQPEEQHALVVQQWCLAEHPRPQDLPEIQLLGADEAAALAPLALLLTPTDPAGTTRLAAELDRRRVGRAVTTSRLLVALVADQTPPAVAVALREHLRSLQSVTGHEVSLALVDQHPDPRVGELLTLVEGAEVLRPGRLLGVGEAWESAWDRTPSDLVLLTTATSVPDATAVTRLVHRLATTPDAVAAYPGSSGPAAALVRTSALQQLRQRHGRGVPRNRAAVLAVNRLHHRLAALGDIEVVTDSAFAGLPLRQEPTTARPGWTTAQLSLAHPRALTVGPWSYFTGTGSRVVTYEAYERVEIGSYCSIADEVRLVNPGHPDRPVTQLTGERGPVLRRNAHRLGAATTFPVGNRFPGLDDFQDAGTAVPGSGGVLSVGHDVWIGFGAQVVGDVTIGHGAVIGAGAVVTKDVPPYAVVSGNPARVVRHRIDPSLVPQMLAIAWWEWPESLVMERAAWFARPVEEFVARFGPAATRTRPAPVARFDESCVPMDALGH
jgi:acetyltransferase-like isoleucine patch superfamily enzyme